MIKNLGVQQVEGHLLLKIFQKKKDLMNHRKEQKKYYQTKKLQLKKKRKMFQKLMIFDSFLFLFSSHNTEHWRRSNWTRRQTRSSEC